MQSDKAMSVAYGDSVCKAKVILSLEMLGTVKQQAGRQQIYSY